VRAGFTSHAATSPEMRASAEHRANAQYFASDRARAAQLRDSRRRASVRWTGLSDYASTPGNQDVLVFRRMEHDATEFVLTTSWDSLDAIRASAGEDYIRARYYPEDDHYLLEKNRRRSLRRAITKLVRTVRPASRFWRRRVNQSHGTVELGASMMAVSVSSTPGICRS